MSARHRARSTSGASGVVASSPWIVVSVGVVVMVVLLVVALGTYRSRGPVALVLPEPTEVPLPSTPMSSVSGAPTERPVPVAPRLSPHATPSTSPTGSTRPARSVSPSADPGVLMSAPASPAEPTLAPAPEVTGTYRVLNDFGREFIGEVLVRNASGTEQDWTVGLRFPGARLVGFWVEGAPQARVSRSGDTWTFSSGARLASGGSVPLRFHYAHTRANRPARCLVNNTDCAGLD